MKKLFIHLTVLFFLSLCFSFTASTSSSSADNSQKEVTALNSPAIQSAKARVEGDVQVEFKQSEPKPIVSGNIFFENWGIITLSFLTFLEGLVRLTPSEKDNSILKILTSVLNVLIPNLKKGGGTH